MSTNIDQILRIYNVKPKKQRKGRKGKDRDNGQMDRRKDFKRIHSLERKEETSPTSTKRLKSLEPKVHRFAVDPRAYSLKTLPGSSSLNTTLEDSLDHLQECMLNGNKARSSRLSVQLEMLKLGISDLMSHGNLESIEELDDLHVEDMGRPIKGDFSPAEALLHKYVTELESKVRKAT